MSTTTQEGEEECAALLAIKILGRKWIPWILCELLAVKELYFSDLLERIEGNYGEKISARVLSEALKMLEESNLITREVVSDEMPVRVKYSLTEKGIDLRVIFGVLKGWGMKWGEIRTKKCRSFSCIHNCVPMIDIDKAGKLLELRDPIVFSPEELQNST
ncbi:MAG: helix-turn-helix transcriptional regulator [Candidatus Heimdallarchaeota archaeon]|nr:MAG: helix-turn-helix transcriptional regulator [Candidatus Heimdallarchaeota archaeon]